MTILYSTLILTLYSVVLTQYTIYVLQVTHHTRSNVEEDKQKREEFKSLRCCALQWAYIDAMTTKAIRQQEEQAKCQIYQLHASLVNIMDENKSLQNEIATIEHQMAVDATLHAQVRTILITLICPEQKV